MDKRGECIVATIGKGISDFDFGPDPGRVSNICSCCGRGNRAPGAVLDAGPPHT